MQIQTSVRDCLTPMVTTVYLKQGSVSKKKKKKPTQNKIQKL